MKVKAKIIYLPVILCIGVILAISIGCEKEEEIVLPTITTAEVTDITSTTATSGGNVTDDGNGDITSRGLVWATSTNPTAEDNDGKTIEIPGTGKYTSEITGLTRNTIYYVRAYATNKAGIAYGNELEFTTEGEPAAITTTAITDITATSATGGGNITDDGGADITERGIVWSLSENPTTESNDGITTDGDGTGSFESGLTNLEPDTEYFVRAYSVSSLGTNYGEQGNFTTLDGKVSITTTAVSSINISSAQSGGNITNDGGAPVTARGVVWSTTENPTIENNEGLTEDGEGSGSFISNLTDLDILTNYYVRAYATNSIGTSYGNPVIFTTLMPDGPGSIITDVDGNIYNTIWINNKQWMKENLKTTKYNDDTPIPNITSIIEWNQLTTGTYAWYNNDEGTYKDPYGGLYNWYAVETGKLCPSGWHVPSNSEYNNLITYLGGTAIAGGKMKETGTEHWASPNSGATNESGFTALPGGTTNAQYGTFNGINEYALIWTSSESTSNYDVALLLVLYHTGSNIAHNTGSGKMIGRSVRCIKDTE